MRKKIVKIFGAVANLQEHAGDQVHIGRRDSQLLHGEEFEVDSILNGWAAGRSKLDGYQGHIRLTDIDGQQMSNWLVLGQVVGVHIRDEFLRDGLFDTFRAQPIMRAGYRADYAQTGPRFEMIRPK